MKDCYIPCPVVNDYWRSVYGVPPGGTCWVCYPYSSDVYAPALFEVDGCVFTCAEEFYGREEAWTESF